MSIPAHFLHVYQKPKMGTGFVSSKQAYNYRHQISAVGWFDTASCDLNMTPIESELAVENWVGNPVKIFVDNPSEPIWEGIITTVTYDTGGLAVRRSLDAMINAAMVAVYRVTGAAPYTRVSNANWVDPSIAIYGVKAGTIDAYVVWGNFSNYIASIRDTLINTNAWPQSSITPGRNRNVHVEMKGYYHTLDWEMFYDTNAVNRNPHALIGRILDTLDNGDLWFDNTDKSGLESNTSWDMNDTMQTGMTKWQGMLRIQEGGNTNGDYHIVGIEPTNPVTGTRRLYYRIANPAVEYTALAKDGLRVRNQFGGLVRPWTVKPDRVLRVTDTLVGWNAEGDDPRDVYLRAINYDAERQQVQWQSGDNTTGEGIFQIKEYMQRHDNRFSDTKMRTAWS